MKQVNSRNRLVRPPPKKVVALFLYPKLTMKRGKEYGIEICRAGYGRNTVVIGRSYHLYSSKQRADDIEVVVAAEAGEKDFDQDQPLKAVNPHLVAKGYAIENRGFTDYVLYVDDLVKA